ncbi:MAG: hypothetical protein IBJ11_08520 [Phycisphaerales bacterium]|nr:hypothetical protein [Phycisphaerales bacterium]
MRKRLKLVGDDQTQAPEAAVSLRFPTGGVFGPSHERAQSSAEVARHVEAVLDRMQLRLDELSREIDALHLPTDDHRPAA